MNDKCTVFILLLIAGIIPRCLQAQDTTALLMGQVIAAEASDPLPFANVAILQKGKLITGTVTDLDGYYRISLAPGTYEVEASYTGFALSKVTGLVIKAEDTIILQHFHLKPAVIMGCGVSCPIYSIPLIDLSNTTSGSIIRSEDIRRLPVRK